MLRREWERARAASATARGNGAAQPENLSSVRRVAREVLAQVQLHIFLLLFSACNVAHLLLAAQFDHCKESGWTA